MFNFERTSITTRTIRTTRDAEWPTTTRRAPRENFVEKMEDMRTTHELKMASARREHNVQMAQSYAAHEAKMAKLRAAKELEERLARIF